MWWAIMLVVAYTTAVTIKYNIEDASAVETSTIRRAAR